MCPNELGPVGPVANATVSSHPLFPLLVPSNSQHPAMWPFTSPPPLAPSAYDLPFPLPVISLTDSLLYSAIFTSVYVGSLYLSKASRFAPSSSKSQAQTLSRDHPEVIKARLKLVIGASFGCCFGVWGLVQYASDQKEGREIVSFVLFHTLSPSPH